jgi:hypothetical protein
MSIASILKDDSGTGNHVSKLIHELEACMTISVSYVDGFRKYYVVPRPDR